MGLFSRRKQEPLDPHLTFMTVDEADELRRLAADVLERRGVQVTVTGGEAVTPDRTVYPLWDVATICQSCEREEWPVRVEEYLTGLLGEETPSPEDMTAEDVLGMVRFRLAEESYVRFMPEPPGGVTPFAPGVVRHLVLDTPDTVLGVGEQVLTDKAPMEDLLVAADRNTRELVDMDLRCEEFPTGGGSVHVIVGESLFTATMALYLSDVVRRFAPEADTSGIVFALPARHQIAFHVPTDAEAVRRVVPGLLRMARTGYDEGAGPISPDLYYWEDGTVTALTEDGPDGRLRLAPTGRLRDLLGDDDRL